MARGAQWNGRWQTPVSIRKMHSVYARPNEDHGLVVSFLLVGFRRAGDDYERCSKRGGAGVDDCM